MKGWNRSAKAKIGIINASAAFYLFGQDIFHCVRPARMFK